MSCNLIKPKSFLKGCISVVSKYVDCHDPLMFESINAIKGVFVLRNTTTLMNMYGRPLFYLLRIKNSKGLYVHISITLKAPSKGASIETNHWFEGISVQFIQGMGKPFCRAEWDVKRNIDKLEHPQPHWHWGFEKECIEPLVFENCNEESSQEGGFLQDVKEMDTNILPNVDFEELHYAMAAKWTLQDSTKEEFSIQNLYNWLNNCLANIIDQYNYQVSKSSFISTKNW